MDDLTNEPPTKIQAIEIPEAESDAEYEAVPKKLKKKTPPEPVISADPVPVAGIADVPVESKPIIPEPVAPDATDDDWLRNRTNRLLDLVDPADLPVGQETAAKEDADVVMAESISEVAGPNKTEQPPEVDAPKVEEEGEAAEDEKPDPVIEAIKSNGRLFVRNLPYTASEEELREHFAPYGSLEEVRIPCELFLTLFLFFAFHDEYPDRDSLCFKACDVNLDENFSRYFVFSESAQLLPYMCYYYLSITRC